MKTTMPTASAPQWIILDAKDQSIGRVAVTAASILRGKHRAHFSPHRPCGDHVIVLNVKELCVHPAKMSQKKYHRHTGWFGHLKTEHLEDMLQTHPEKAVERAVWGMLPKNRLRPRHFQRLHVFEGKEHPFAAQKPSPMKTNISRGLSVSPLNKV